MCQSNYISWKGYFDLIRNVDVFVLCDEVQYTKQDWRNRNLIKTSRGLQWLVIPVTCPEDKPGAVEDYRVADPRWARKHWGTLRSEYGNAPYFRAYGTFFENLYGNSEGGTLSEINEKFIRSICRLLSIRTEIIRSNPLNLPQDRNDRIIEAAKRLGIDTYLSGPSAKAYLDAGRFSQAGVGVKFANYSGYPEYPQPHPPFAHQVSIVDLILSTGPQAVRYMKAM